MLLFISVCLKSSEQAVRCIKRSRNYMLTHAVTFKLRNISSRLDKSIKSNAITALDRPRGFREVEAPIFHDNWHMKVVRLSALRTSRLYPLGNISGTHFC